MAWVLVGLIIGAYVGQETGRVGAGVVLGILFGPVGALVVAALGRTADAESDWRRAVQNSPGREALGRRRAAGFDAWSARRLAGQDRYAAEREAAIEAAVKAARDGDREEFERWRKMQGTP